LSGDLLDIGVSAGVIAKRGNAYGFGEEKLGVGRETAKRYLKDNPKLMKEIRKQIVAEMKSKEDDGGGSRAVASNVVVEDEGITMSDEPIL
jgi:hypothetical protein